jgi:dinuclear metal center YbgI/SA1388 family protein
MKIKEICNFLEEWAPLSNQEDYDNSGLIIGDFQSEIRACLISLDITLEVLDEAISKGCNLIIAHHPLIFKGLKKINGKNYVEKLVIKAIKNDIAIYGIHTNLDNQIGGVNFKIAEKLGLENVKILQVKSQTLRKLTVFVPLEFTAKVSEALFEAGAGNIGKYSKCSFSAEGYGSFMPNENSNPFIGQANMLEKVAENRVEVIFPYFLETKILNAMNIAHPYEEVAYYLQKVENQYQEIGAGAVGDLPQEMESSSFLEHVKTQMQAKVLRHTALCFDKITKVAVCGGVGSFLLNDAKKAGAQVFVSSDFKYHEFFDAENQIIIADIGHYESEQYTKDLILEKISKKFTNFASYLSEVDTNPVNYLV